ncbi:MAG: ATP phosphoribosyltransferase [Thermoplasmatota archaeon]
MTLKIAIPNKGRLADASLELFREAGMKVELTNERRLFATALDRSVTILFVRAQDIPEYVQDGVVHLGVTGLDIIEEAARDVERLADLKFGYCRLVLAVPDESSAKSAKDLPDGARVASVFPHLTKRFFESAGKRVSVVEVSGAAEVTPMLGVADAVVDLTSSGNTLAMNHLREVETLLVSTARVVANRAALADRTLGPKMREVLAALESVVAARGKRYLMANVPRSRLDEVRRILPGISGPTVMELAHVEGDKKSDFVAAHAVVDEAHLYDTVNALKRVGATGILVLPIERLVP